MAVVAGAASGPPGYCPTAAPARKDSRFTYAGLVIPKYLAGRRAATMSDTSNGTGSIDPMEDAVAELAGNMVPNPEDLFKGLSPNASLWFLQQSAYTALGKWAEMLAPGDATGEFDGTDVTKAFYAVTAVCGMLDEACVLVGILPPEAAVGPGEPSWAPR